MTPDSLRSMTDELAKIAATIEQLGKGFRRLGVVRVPRMKRGGEWQTTKLMGEVAGATEPFHMSPQQITAFTGGVSTLPSRRLLKRIEPSATRHNIASLVESGLDEQAARELVSKSAPFAPVAPGRQSVIMTAKGGTPQLQQELGMLPEQMSPDALRGSAYTFGHHEGFERAVKPHEVAFGHGHNSPQVLMKQHNLLSGLTGPGAAEVRQAMDIVPAIQGFGSIEAGAARLYGPRAQQFLEPGRRIPRAMRKDLTRRAVAGELPEWTG